jgi:hypothetical protein
MFTFTPKLQKFGKTKVEKTGFRSLDGTLGAVPHYKKVKFKNGQKQVEL